MAGTVYKKTSPLTEKDWRISVQQTLLPSSEYGLTGESAKIYPYVYTDGDGTEHYFYKKTKNGITEYVDEDGLKLKITINSTGYKITGEKGSVLEFNTKGLLQKLADANGNNIIINYAADGKTIQSVQDGAGKKVTFVPNSNGSGSLSRMTDPAGRQCIFYYTTKEIIPDIWKKFEPLMKNGYFLPMTTTAP